MGKSLEDLNLLLLQIRDNPVVKKEEWESFAHYAGVKTSQIEILNVFENPNFDIKIAKNYDALLIGGASEASVLEPEKYPFVKNSIELVKFCVKEKIPTFASCFGFQLAVLALGGEVIRDTENFEMGTLPIQTTDIANNDPVYKDISSGFFAVSVHQEKSLELPSSCELLAYTDQCCHSFKVKDAPFWAFQFHPELDKVRLTERLGVYRDKYTEHDNHYAKIIDSLVDTDDSNRLVKNFIQNVLL